MIRCIIIEDEPLARDVLLSYIEAAVGLELKGVCKSALEARKILETKEIDLLFLDINMPGISGLDFYKTLAHRPQVIFTTAYAEFAVDGFELEAIDYLLKPFSFERFEKALSKLKPLGQGETDYLMLKADKRIHKINYHQICYFESVGDYVKVILKDSKNLIVSDTLKHLESILPGDFIRVHKSYIISIPKMEYLEGNQFRVNGVMIPIGQSYKASIQEKFKK